MNAGLVKVTARVLGIDYVEIDVSEVAANHAKTQAAQAETKKAKAGNAPAEKDPVAEIRAKSITGKFPILETAEGFTIFEATSIAKYFARQRKGFYGSNDFESKCVLMSLLYHVHKYSSISNPILYYSHTN